MARLQCLVLLGRSDMAALLGKQLRNSTKASIRGSIAGYKGSQFSSATLDLRFALQKTLDPRITFTRASSATFVDSSGVLRSAVTNLLLRSEEFDNASWSKDSTVATANQTTAPNGTLTADKVAEDTSTNFHAVSQYVAGFASGAVLTLSIYAKAAGRTKFRIQTDSTGGTGTADFDLSAATATSGTGVFSAGSIQVVGDGWYRCSVRCTTSGAGAIGLKVILAATTYGTSYTGDGTSGLFIWGAQLEQASTVGDYVPTTSVINSAPRFDHNPTTGESLGLLVEEARTNLLLRSEAIATGPWFNSNVTLTNNTSDVLDPAGGSTATKVVSTGSSSAFGQPVTLTAAIYAGSIWLRSSTGNISAQLIVYLGGAPFTNIGTTNVTITTTWQRFSVITSAATAASYNIQLNNIGAGTVYAWGAQLEAGAFPTSYIPTTSATVTRAADVASITGANFSFYNQTEGTVFASGDFVALGANSFSRIVSLAGANTGTDEISIYTRVNVGSGDGTIFGAVTVSSSLEADLNSPAGAPNLSGAYRSALAYKTNDFGLATNGLTPTVDTSGTLPTITQLIIMGNVRFQNKLSGHVRRLTFWPTRLANTTLQQISQP